MDEIMIKRKELEYLLNDVNGLLAILHQEESAGLQETSLRVEINALEALVWKMYKLGGKKVNE